jgi:hypothetical protein
MPCDLHVLGTPPAFTLSQDQTLHHEEFSPFTRRSLLRALSLKESKCLLTVPSGLETSTHGGRVPHVPLRVPYCLWHVLLTDQHSPLPSSSSLRKKDRQRQVPLCSTLLLFRCCRTFRSVFPTGTKNPEATLACSGSIHNCQACLAMSPGAPVVRLLSCSTCAIVTSLSRVRHAASDCSVQRRSL